MVNRILQGKQPIIYGSGNQMRCFSFMDDVISPLMLACETDVVDGMVVNIGPDEEFISINDLAIKIAHKLNFKLEPIYMPGRPQEVLHANCSADLARQLLNYETKTNLDEGLQKLISWIESKGPKPFDYHLPIEFVTEKTPRTWTEKLI
jgi:UDP-glucose 4-epimerase